MRQNEYLWSKGLSNKLHSTIVYLTTVVSYEAQVNKPRAPVHISMKVTRHTCKQIFEVYKIPQPTPVSLATPTTFDLDLRIEKSFDLHMFTGNIFKDLHCNC